MQKLILLSVCLLCTLLISNNAFNQIQRKHYFAPFQGKKIFCSTGQNQKMFITITGNAVKIIIGNKKIAGIYKSSKILLTNDPAEKQFRKTSGNYHYGTYYVIAKDYVSILEPENGEYPYNYQLCKQ